MTDELVRIAEALEQSNAHGPWTWHHAYPQQVTNAAAVIIAECFEDPDQPSRLAEFIATWHPSRALAALAVIEAARMSATTGVDSSAAILEERRAAIAAAIAAWDALDEDDPYPDNPGPFGTNPGEC